MWIESQKDTTDWSAIDALQDDDIAKAVSNDPDAAPLDAKGLTLVRVGRPQVMVPLMVPGFHNLMVPGFHIFILSITAPSFPVCGLRCVQIIWNRAGYALWVV